MKRQRLSKEEYEKLQADHSGVNSINDDHTEDVSWDNLATKVTKHTVVSFAIYPDLAKKDDLLAFGMVYDN